MGIIKTFLKNLSDVIEETHNESIREYNIQEKKYIVRAAAQKEI